jgi:hypothetical protein
MQNFVIKNKKEKGVGLFTHMKPRQIEFLKVLEECEGCVRDAYHRAGISKQTYYNWKAANAEFKEKAEKIITAKKEQMDDYTESKLFGLIANNNVPAILFYLRMKHPSYNPTTKVEVEVNPFKYLSDDQLKTRLREITSGEPQTGGTQESQLLHGADSGI